MDTVFDLRNISYSYAGKINALKDISLKVGHGEQISIIGSDGSGKSTLLAILNGRARILNHPQYGFRASLGLIFLAGLQGFNP
jgi:ABC-type phosphate/phosphonate transport system ATPase subunit